MEETSKAGRILCVCVKSLSFVNAGFNHSLNLSSMDMFTLSTVGVSFFVDSTFPSLPHICELYHPFSVASYFILTLYR